MTHYAEMENADLWRVLAAALDNHRGGVLCIKVRSHNNNPHNDEVDHYATQRKERRSYLDSHRRSVSWEDSMKVQSPVSNKFALSQGHRQSRSCLNHVAT